MDLAVDDRLLLHSDGFEQAFPARPPTTYDDACRAAGTAVSSRALRRAADGRGHDRTIGHRLDDQQGSLHQIDDLTLVCVEAGPVTESLSPAAAASESPCEPGQSVSILTRVSEIRLTERRLGERLRNERDLEARGGPSGDGERYAVDRDRTLLDDALEQLRRRLDVDPPLAGRASPPSRRQRHRYDLARRGRRAASSASPRAGGPTGSPTRSEPSVVPHERLRNDVEADLAGRLVLRHGQAAPVHRNR